MKKLMNGAQMKMIDTYSIQEVGIPSLVLMERAALCVTEAVLERRIRCCACAEAAITVRMAWR